MLLVSVLAISWGGPLVRLSSAHAVAVSFWRLAFSVALVAVVLTVRGEWGALRRLSRGDLATAALAGVLLAGHFASWIASLALTSVAASVLLVSTAPVFVAVLSALFLRERPGRNQWLGIVLAVAGAAWIGWGDFQGGAAPLRGDLLALAGAVLVAGYYVIGRRLRARIDIWPFVGVVYGCAALTLLAALPLAGVPLGGYPAGDWAVFAALAVGPMLVGHTGQNWALRYLPAYVVNLSLLGEPVGATLIAWLLPGIAETPPPAALGGGGLILCGILLGMARR
ncbi:MAG TPA: DMT family transporter [Longimicrobiaceae bacterium]|nr:DMT family transporter [Longimicrobiaceae bacterium]